MSDDALLAEATAATPTAPFALEPAWLRAARPGVAWQGLRELHLRAIGSDFRFTTTAGHMTKDAAFATYGAALAATLAQIAVADVATANRILDSLADHGGAMGSLDGLESPFLSAFSASFGAGATPSVLRAATLWRSIGQPRQLGGGALTTPVVGAGGVLALVSAEDLAPLGEVEDASALALGVADLFRTDTRRARDPARDGAGATLERALRDLARTVTRLAAGVAGAAELEQQLEAHGPGVPAAVTRVLERVQVQGRPLLQAGGTIASIAKGKLVVVEIGVVADEPVAPAEPHPGPPVAIAPRVPSLAPPAAGTIDLPPSPFWRGGALPPVPAFALTAAGLDLQLHPRGHTVALPARPRLNANGTVNPRGILESLLDPPPGSPAPAGESELVARHPLDPSTILFAVPLHGFPPLIHPEEPGHAGPLELERLAEAVAAALARARG